MPTLDEETTRFIAAWMKLRQIIQAANFNRFQRAGLSATQFMTLNVVPDEGLTLTELARKLNLSPATLSETINSLEERGLVRRRRHAGDARRIAIRATKKGKEMQNSASEEFHAFISGLFRRVSKTQREGILTGLEQIITLNEGDNDPAAVSRRVGASVPVRHSSPRSR